MNKKIKIIYLITGLGIGGAEMVVKNLAEGLGKDNFEVVVVSISPLAEVGESMKGDNLSVISLNARFKFDPRIIFRLFKLLKKEKPNIVHTHLFHADILGRIVGKLSNVPKIITTIHNVNIGGKTREFFIRLTRNLSDYDIAVSKAVLDNALTQKMSNESKAQVIYNGISLDKFTNKDKIETRKKLNIPLDKKVFISIGSLTHQKGYGYLVEAVKEINNNNIICIILGEGPERLILEKEILDNNLNEKIILKGNVSNVNDYLQAADVFLMPSLWEGFSIALLEAMACGKVVIATSVGGNPEVVKNGKNGYLTKHNSVEEFIGKIKIVLELTENEIVNISNNARNDVKKQFSISIMVSKHEYLYNNILNYKI